MKKSNYWLTEHFKKQLINTRRLILSKTSMFNLISDIWQCFGVIVIFSYVWYMYSNILRQMIELFTCSLRTLLLINLAMKECSWNVLGMWISWI